ncbi:MAG: hypothetical protein ACTSPP_11490 [Candidatus Heimdallarchaeaceae archaeon]
MIIQSFIQQQMHSKEVLEELKKIVTEINEAKKEEEEKGIPKEAFTIYWIMKQNGINNPEQKAIEVSKIMGVYKYWKNSKIMKVLKEG